MQLEEITEQMSLLEMLRGYNYPPHRCTCTHIKECPACQQWNKGNQKRNSIRRTAQSTAACIARIQQALLNPSLTRRQRKGKRYYMNKMIERLHNLQTTEDTNT